MDMRKSMLVVVILAAVAVAGFAATADSARKPGIRFTDRLGPERQVAPGTIAEARAKCPRGYAATGGGSYAGPIEHVVDGVTGDGKGWFVDGFNPSSTTTVPHSVDVRCARGNSRLVVRASRVTAQKRAEARRNFLAVHGK
jgi:hypothetical protein